MAMTIMNDPSAMLTLGELNKNVSKLGKQLKKVSSGMKINSAGDDASGYAISERMRAQIRSLDQDTQNVQNGKSLLRVAEGGIQSIIEEIRTLKELALNSANDTNTDLDRATIQKEFENRKANINDIATETSYNGKTLLDGTYRKKIMLPATAIPSTPTTKADWQRIMERDGVTNINGNYYVIDKDGAYSFDENFKGKVIVNAQNVYFVANPAYAIHAPDDPYYNGMQLNIEPEIICQAENTKLWLDNVHFVQHNDDHYDQLHSLIRFGSGTDNELHIAGKSILRDYALWSSHASINIGGGLSVVLEPNVPFDISKQNGMDVPSIGCDIGEDLSSSNISISASYTDLYVGGRHPSEMDNEAGLYFNYGSYWNTEDVPVIGSAKGGKVGDIQFFSGKVVIHDGSDLAADTAVGASASGSAGTVSGVNGTITANDTRWVYEGERMLPDEGEDDEGYKLGTPLVIHHGTKANQALNVYINDMHTWSLKNNIPSVDDLEDLRHDPTLQAVLDEAKNMTLDDAKVVTQHDANVAIRVIEGALQYALNEVTNVGAYISRLDFTEANLVTSSENTQSSESTMRDADMAKEMMEYTKSNVLAQAAQSMLAQANQNSSQVLSLLQ